jgi:hypothetical protein
MKTFHTKKYTNSNPAFAAPAAHWRSKRSRRRHTCSTPPPSTDNAETLSKIQELRTSVFGLYESTQEMARRYEREAGRLEVTIESWRNAFNHEREALIRERHAVDELSKSRSEADWHQMKNRESLEKENASLIDQNAGVKANFNKLLLVTSDLRAQLDHLKG